MTRIDSTQTFEQAIMDMRARIDVQDAEGAVALIDEVEGDEFLCSQFAAVTLTEAGHALGSIRCLTTAVEIWEKIGTRAGEEAVAYNRANAELNLFEAVAAHHGVATAVADRLPLLHSARVHYRLAAETSAAANDRVQAWTNLGNSFDRLGRDLEAIDAYRQALAIDHNFGMAHGNLGIALLGVAPFAGKHAATVGAEGLAELEAALVDEDRVRSIGGARAFEHFGQELLKYTQRGARAAPPTVPVFEEPYLRWVAEHGLALHTSPGCLHPGSVAIDPLFFQFVASGFGDAEEARAKRLIDAYNALKQTFISARYQTWLALDEESPVAQHLVQLEQESPFLDTLLFSRFGVRTGILTHAFAAAMNLLDQIAVFLHLYLQTARSPKEVTMRSLWRKRRKGNLGQFDASLRAVIERGNRGLLALCDLSGDLIAKDSRLAELTELRHAATHRLLVTHWSRTEPDLSGWLERIEFSDLAETALEQLRIARSALVYLARAVDIEEHRAAKEDEAKRASIPLLPTPPEGDLPGY